jgi:dTDP-4-amino-4,6-dideoxygalactose transaminase
MTNINAAIGLSQLARLDEFIANRRRTCQRYDEAFAELDWLITPNADFDQVGPFIYILRVLDGQRENFIVHMRERGIDTGIHFLPLHRKTLCAKKRRGPLTVTEEISPQIVTLPLWSLMPDEVVSRIIDAVCSFNPTRAALAGARR